MRHSTQHGIDLIKTFEGFSSKVYVCPAGYLTIGYGHLIQEHEKNTFDNGISKDVAEILLRHDMMDTERAVLHYIHTPLTDGQFDALVSFTFNLGGGALQRSTLRRKINREQHGDVPNEFLRWVWAGGRKLNGLIRRRYAESQLYQSAI